MKKAGVPSILVPVALLALGVIAEAQQPAKILRLGGFLVPHPVSPRGTSYSSESSVTRLC